MPGAIRKAEEMAAADPRYFIPQQFENPANPEVHRCTTAEEIWRDTDGKADMGDVPMPYLSGTYPLLKDTEPLVQREAVQGLVMALVAVVLVIPAYVYDWKPLKEIALIGELLAITAIGEPTRATAVTR